MELVGELPDWVESFDSWATPVDYDCDVCSCCGEFYWRDKGHDCDFIPTKATNKTVYVEAVM